MDELDLGATIRGFVAGQKVFGRYTLQRILGRGGMGVVWLAQDDSLDREVALKFLPDVVSADPRAVDDLKRETRRSLKLTHPHIVRIYDFVEDARTAAIAMEYVAGDTLSKRALAQPDRIFSPTQLRPWLAQLCAALDYAHAKAQVVHRDLKPANLMVDAQGDLKVADFGIAASVSDSVSRVSAQAGTSGTPVYMSPQQMMGERPAITDDIYALGATLYELLTGKPPFHMGNVLLQVQSKVPPPIAVRREELGVAGDPIPAQWEEVVAACLAKEPQRRPQSAGAVLASLDAAPAPAPATTISRSSGRVPKQAVKEEAPAPAVEPRVKAGNRTGLWAAVAGCVLVAAATAWWFGFEQPERQRTEARQRTEQIDYALVLSKIEGVKPETNPEMKEFVARDVQAYLQSAPERFRGDVDSRWRRQESAWEAARRPAPRVDPRGTVVTGGAGAEPKPGEGKQAAAERPALPVATTGDLMVRTDPAGAEVRVGTLSQASSPFSLKGVPTGDYPVTAKLRGYEDWQGALEVKEGREAVLEIPLARSTGTLALRAEGTGVEVEILGRAQAGEPPVPVRQTAQAPTDLSLPTGSYTVLLRRAGWPEQSKQVEIRRGATVQVDGAFVGGRVSLTSVPAGAEVVVGEKVLGRTPLTLADVLPGAHEYTLRLDGHTSRQVAGTVRAREELSLSAELPKRGPRPGEQWTIPGIGIALLPVRPGTFVMGWSSIMGTTAEDPLTEVTLTADFWLGRTEVTVGQWREVMGTTPTLGADGLPVTQVSWNDAREFCTRLTERERAAGRLPNGMVYSLPSEAQWEYACRAGSAAIRPDDLDPVAWHRGNSGGRVHPVATKAANAWGFHDMYGNVLEWCIDVLREYPGGKVPDFVVNPEQPTYRALRGGSYKSATGKVSMSGGMRSTLRDTWGQAERRPEVGFRIALTKPHPVSPR